MKISSNQVATVRDPNSAMSALEARRLLSDIEGTLRTNEGTMRKGVLTLHRKGDGSYEMGVERHALFRSSKDKRATAEFMTSLLEKAYGTNAQAATVGRGSRFTVGQTVRNLVHLDKLQVSDPAEVSGQIKALEKDLTDGAKKIFGSLLTPQTSTTAGIGKPPTYVLGDSDGSISRMLLMAIHSGHVALDDSSLQTLADVVNNEARALQKGSAYNIEAFQKDQNNAQQLNDVLGKAVFRHSPNSLVFMGDIVHDRMSCDKQATADLVRKLHSNGAVFILGNHDSFDHCAAYPAHDPQVGSFAQRQLTRQEALALEQDCFVHAHFDGSKLYTHNGVEYDQTKDKLYFPRKNGHEN